MGSKFLGRDVRPDIRQDIRGISCPETFSLGCFSVPAKRVGFQKGAFPKSSPERKPERVYIQMFPRNENRNEGTFACSPGTKSRNEGTFAKTNLLRKMPLCLLSIYLRHNSPRASVKCRFGPLSAVFHLFDLLLSCLKCRFGCLSAGFGVLSARFCCLKSWFSKREEKNMKIDKRI